MRGIGKLRLRTVAICGLPLKTTVVRMLPEKTGRTASRLPAASSCRSWQSAARPMFSSQATSAATSRAPTLLLSRMMLGLACSIAALKRRGIGHGAELGERRAVGDQHLVGAIGDGFLAPAHRLGSPTTSATTGCPSLLGQLARLAHDLPGGLFWLCPCR